MTVDLNDKELELVKKSLNSYLSELRLEIVETKHDKQALHAEEDLLKAILQKVSK
ncbi:MAG TPA: hypothetical protein VK448_12070 [Dissulfurispiraceae bacterium]|nr:hypothetical protein [Dissulfurispiraceae bacterium]